MKKDSLKTVIDYHQRTKHHYNRYARGPGGLDWANQPDPFRFYPDALKVDLPFLDPAHPSDYKDLYRRKDIQAGPPDLGLIGAFMELSMALSAWKASGQNRWSLRINPSSGNLHPTEAHLILPSIGNLPAGVYHYSPFFHALELRMKIPEDLWKEMTPAAGPNGFFIGLTSIFWREAWKYGERSFRYCNHDVGHALAALSFAGNLFGLSLSMLEQLSDDAIGILLGLDRTPWLQSEEEHPDLLCRVYPSGGATPSETIPESVLAAFSGLEVEGTPNQLCPKVRPWDIVSDAARLTLKPHTPAQRPLPEKHPPPQGPESEMSAVQVIKQRRSAVSFDGRSRLSRSHFLSMLDKTLPRAQTPPFDALPFLPAVHLVIFVHEVDGLDPGLYLWLRNREDLDLLRKSLKSDFRWHAVVPESPLFFLESGDFRAQSIMISCHQEIAGFGTFSLGMLTRFKNEISDTPWRYRQLFWETGMIGQVLYLEAEARGIRGTGIGCFFDDGFHDLIGLKDSTFQSLYHFTVGNPVEDPRLKNLPPYFHLHQSDSEGRLLSS